MDETPEQIITGLIVNGITEVVRWEGAKASNRSAAEVVMTEVDAAIGQILDVREIKRELGGDRLVCFLKSAEVKTVVAQIYLCNLGSSKARDRIREEFVELWKFSFPKEAASSISAIERLFNVLSRLCEAQIDKAIDIGVLSAHEAKSGRRHKDLIDLIGGLDLAISALRNGESLTREKLDGFLATLRRQVADADGKITPQAVQEQLQVPIDDLYVPGRLVEDSIDDAPGFGIEKPSFHTDEFKHQFRRAVILGSPGAGKSTLAKKIVTDIARQGVRHGNEVPVPILITLKEFGKRKSESPCSIAEYIEELCRVKYQVPVPDGAIPYLLSTGSCLVVFDGLDELLDTNSRSEIRNNVESFAGMYPEIKIIVTSREVGYLEAPLTSERFDTFSLTDFTDEDVREYAGKIFAYTSGGATKEANEEASAFMRDSQSVHDIRSNPLMLSLMCTLYRGSGYIPENRPAVYEACSVLLFESWDRSRQIRQRAEIESMLRPAMQHLAYWMYTNPDFDDGAAEGDIVEEMTDYLHPRRYEDKDEAREVAKEFVAFCRGRAWVFAETAIEIDGTRRYHFTHQTFLEYFTARYLVSDSSNADELLSKLSGRIERQEWDVVAQLSFQIFDSQRQDGGSLLLETLIGSELTESSNRINVLNFASRALSFLVVSPLVLRSIVDETIVSGLRLRLKSLETTENGAEGVIRHPGMITGLSSESIFELFFARSENAKTVADEIYDAIVRLLDDPEVGALAAELGLSVRMRIRDTGEENGPFLKIASRLTDEKMDALRDLAAIAVGVAHELVWRSKLTVTEFVDMHGVSELFVGHADSLRARASRVSILDTLVGRLYWGDGYGQTNELAFAGQLSDSLKALENAPTPWLVSAEGSTSWLVHHVVSSSVRSWRVRWLDLSVDERGGAALLIACALEMAQLSGEDDLLCDLPEPTGYEVEQVDQLDLLRRLLKSKQYPLFENPYELLDDWDLPSSAKSLLTDWLEGSIELIEGRSGESW